MLSASTQPVTEAHAPDQLSNGQQLSPDRAPVPTNTPPALSDRSLSSSPNQTFTKESIPPITPPIRAQPSSTNEIPTCSTHSMVTRHRDNSRRPKKFNDFVAYKSELPLEPVSFKEANSSPEWRAAMASEIDALARNNTWVLVPSSDSQRVVGCRWVYKIKQKQDGSIDRFKARLVAKGYNQQEGVDFSKTYSPVIRPTTIRLILSLAVSSNWSIRQLDVHNAFLHGDLEETVLMAQPPGFVDPAYPDHVCLLKKSLYGLKQAPRAWFQKLSHTLLEMGFKASNYDPSLFIAHQQHHLLLILVYVDDILVTGSNEAAVQHCVQSLSSQFSLKDLGPLSFFLGIEVTHNSQGMFLSQKKYINDLLTRANMATTKACPSPIATGTSLSKTDGPSFNDAHLYRSIIGALQYATLTRPDISFSVNKLSQFMQNPTTTHWAAVKRLLRYLRGTDNHGLLIRKDSDNTIHAYSDADWAGSVDDRRSTSGFCIFLGRNLISWSSRKQPIVSRSSTEAEYRSLALTCQEILWIQYLLAEIHVSYPSPPTLWCDNIGATFLAANPMFHARTKHIEIDYHFVRERVMSKSLIVRFLCSADQLGDILTKPLPTPRFEYLRSKLNVLQNTLA